MTDCPFCELAAGQNIIVIEPLNPVVPGHLLVIPEQHVTDALDDPLVTGRVMTVAAITAREKGGQWNIITSAGADATQTVFHLHVHLVPRTPGDGLKLPWSP